MIREAQVSDCQHISILANAAWWAHYPSILSDAQIAFMLQEMYAVDKLSHQMEVLGHKFLVMVDANETLEGFASVSPTDTGGAWKLHKLYLHPQAKGSGKGRQLLSEVEKLVKKHGGTKLLLNVNRANTAVTFYQRYGFSKEEEVDIPYHHFVLNDFIMVKSLL
jgi:ribosomal protein S18 acetylase RimI-like enzyme